MENIEQLIGKYIDNVETPANRLNVTENNITPAGNGLEGGAVVSKNAKIGLKRWNIAVKDWNVGRFDDWCVPKKGTKDYDEVKEMMERLPTDMALLKKRDAELNEDRKRLKKKGLDRKTGPKAKLESLPKELMPKQAPKPAPKKMTIKKKKPEPNPEPKASSPKVEPKKITIKKKAEPKKSSGKLSAWQMYVKENMKSGVTMKQLSEEFKNKKPEPKKNISMKIKKAEPKAEPKKAESKPEPKEQWTDEDESNLQMLEMMNKGAMKVDVDILEELRAKKERVKGKKESKKQGSALKGGEKPYHNDLPAYKTPEAEAPRSNSKKIANKTAKLIDESNSTNFFKQEAVLGQSYSEPQPEEMTGKGKIMRKGMNPIESINRRVADAKQEKLGGMMMGKGAKTRGHLVYSNYNNQDPAQFSSPMSKFTNPQNISREILSQMLMKGLESSFRTKS
jgi:hypothetical protein